MIPPHDPESIWRATTSYVKEARAVDIADCRWGWTNRTSPFWTMNLANCGKVFQEHYPLKTRVN